MLITIYVVILAVLFALLVLPLSKSVQDALSNNPKNPDKLALWTSLEPWQTKALVRRGRFIRLIRGTQDPDFRLDPWGLYDWYVWHFGLRLVGIPGLQSVYLYEIHQLEMTKDTSVENGHEVIAYHHAPKTTLSDHVRTRNFTFHFRVSGAEVDAIPVTAVGSIEARFLFDEETGDKANEYKAFFASDSWTILLNQVVTSVIPSVVRTEITLAGIIGEVSAELWKEAERESLPEEEVTEVILKRIREYKLRDSDNKEVTLHELLGIQIMAVNVTEFILDITEEELKKLRSSVYGRQIGRGRDLEGQGEAALQKNIIDAAKQGGAHGHTALQSESLVRAAKSGNLDVLLTALTQYVRNQPTITGGRDDNS